MTFPKNIYLSLFAIMLFIAFFYIIDHLTFKQNVSDILKSRGINISSAISDVEILSEQSRYVGTQGHLAAQNHIEKRLEASIGRNFVTKKTETVESTIRGIFIQSQITNIIGFIPAASPTRNISNVALFAHYDSAESSYGANDNAAGVATLLAIADYAQKLTTRNFNLWIVFVDAEEIGLLGSKAIRESEFLADIDYALNIEARGSSGHSVIFEHLGQDSHLVHFLNSSSVAFTDSLVLDIYKILPNMTDVDQLSLGLSQRIQLLINTAYFGNGFAYHNEYDNKESLNIDGLRQHIALSVEFLDYAAIINGAMDNGNMDHFTKTIFKSLSFSVPKKPAIVTGLILACILLLLTLYINRSYFSKTSHQSVQSKIRLIKVLICLLSPIISIALIVLFNVVLSRFLGDIFALSTYSAFIYFPVLIGVISVIYAYAIRDGNSLALARISSDLLLIIATAIVCLLNHSSSIVFAAAALFRCVGIIVKILYPLFSLHALTILLVAFFLYNLHLLEVLIYLGGIKLPLIMTTIVVIGISGNVIEFIEIYGRSRSTQNKDVKVCSAINSSQLRQQNDN